MNTKNMITTVLIMFVIAVLVFLIALNKGLHVKGFEIAFKMGVKVLPLIIIAFVIVGMTQALSSEINFLKPSQSMSGWKGLGVASLIGIITPGGTFMALPFTAMILKSGAGIGAAVSYYVSWAIWEVLRTPLELSFLGWKFLIVKWCIALIIPILAGALAKLLFSWIQF